MGKLTAAARKKLPSTAFAEPAKRAYPINDRSHAKNALSRVSRYGTAAEKGAVHAAVHRHFPGMGK